MKIYQNGSALALLAALTALATAALLRILLALLTTLLLVLFLLAALLLAALLAGFLLLLLLVLFLLAALATLLATLILLITHGTLPAVRVSDSQREASLLGSLFRWRVIGSIVGAVSIISIARAEERGACDSTVLGSFDAGAVVDARGFKLRDGREVLLAGIEVPSGSAAARGLLEKLLASGKVVLKQAEAASDRYGRLSAQAFVPGDGAEHWIQQDLLAAGYAQVGSRPGGCAKALLMAEAAARRGRLGLWADSAYNVKASDDLAGLLGRQGRFTVAEGKVLSVRESGGTIYINFGRAWSRNLTVTILRRNRPAFEAAGMEPKKLEGLRLRVRGWIEERNGPRIDAARPEQIEIATGG